MISEEINNKLDQLEKLEDKYHSNAAILYKNILKEGNSEINARYFAEEMIENIKQMIELIKVFRGQNIDKDEKKKCNNYIKKEIPLNKEDLLVMIKNEENEYDTFSLAFKLVISDDKSEINSGYLAGEMIKFLKRIIKLIENIISLSVEEEKHELNSLENKGPEER